MWRSLVLFFFFALSLFSEPCSSLAADVSAPKKLKVLVLGGSGFVGSRFIEKAADRFDIVSVSRRGRPAEFVKEGLSSEPEPLWLKVDATDGAAVQELFDVHGPFDGVFHSIGLLLDKDSGLSKFNKFASGSGSVPGSSATYDAITRQTAINAIDAFLYSGKTSDLVKKKPFVFISAAEAGWTFPAPVSWLEKYLVAKRAVESTLLGCGDKIRPVIFRPSLIWTPKRPQALVSVLPFYLAALVKVPFVDKPTPLEALIDAAICAIEDQDTTGIKRIGDIETLASALRTRQKEPRSRRRDSSEETR